MSVRRTFTRSLCAAIACVVVAWAGCDRGEAPLPTPAVSIPAAPASSSPAGPVTPPDVVRRPLLWEIESHGKRGWLFGTFHMGIEATSLPRQVWSKLEEADRFMMELDMTDPELPAAIAQEGTLPANRSLEVELGPALWPQTVRAAGQIPPAALDRLEPWLVSVTIAAEFFPKTAPLDRRLQEQAHKEGDTVLFLETWRQQVAALESSIDVEVLRDNVLRLEDQRAMAVAMRKAYLDGDVARFEAAVFDPEEVRRHPALYETLFRRRNEAWLPKLEAELAAGDVFVAVGAGHLVGDEGLLALLEGRGMTTRRLEGATP